jgi:CRISPR type IV-associated protein Csf2
MDENDTAALKKGDLANMFAFQCIRAGLPLYLELAFSSAPNKAQVGLLLEALLSIFNENALGGLVRLGSGRFEGFANLVVDGVVAGPILQHQQSGKDDNVDAGFVLTDLAVEFIEAKDEAVAASSAADLERFFKYGVPAETPAEPDSEAA